MASRAKTSKRARAASGTREKPKRLGRGGWTGLAKLTATLVPRLLLENEASVAELVVEGPLRLGVRPRTAEECLGSKGAKQLPVRRSDLVQARDYAIDDMAM